MAILVGAVVGIERGAYFFSRKRETNENNEPQTQNQNSPKIFEGYFENVDYFHHQVHSTRLCRFEKKSALD